MKSLFTPTPCRYRLRFLSARGQSGAALLAAMLTVTLVATFAAAALWQQWRSVEVETAERARVQSSWILTGALDWSRLILREDGRASSGIADHLAEPWSVPLNEARLSSFLAVDKNATDTEREAFLSGRVNDLQARLNVSNLVEGNSLSASGMESFGRLFELLGLPTEQVLLLGTGMLQALRDPAPVSGAGAASATPPTQGASAAVAPQAVISNQTTSEINPMTPLMPQRVDQLVWLGIPRETLSALAPHITLLPQRTPVNLNTASAEVIYASTPGLGLADAQRIIAARERKHFNTLAEASQQLGSVETRFSDSQHSVGSRFFEVTGRLRLDQTVVQERSVLQRDGGVVRTLWRDRGVIISPPP